MPKAQFPLSLSCLKEAVDQRAAPTVVLCDGVVAGFVDLYDCDPGTSCRIGNVIVSPHFRGRGVATRLIQEMVDVAADEYNAKRVELACFNNNKPARCSTRSSGSRRTR